MEPMQSESRVFQRSDPLLVPPYDPFIIVDLPFATWSQNNLRVGTRSGSCREVYPEQVRCPARTNAHNHTVKPARNIEHQDWRHPMQ
jgi:hypothetical protein